MKAVSNIEINLDLFIEGLRLWIDARRPDTLFDAEDFAKDYNEARFQLVEGCIYDYQINNSNFVLGDVGQNIIHQHKRTSNLGTISPNIFVGKLIIPISHKESSQICHNIEFEVQSIKSGYRDDYRDMLDFITDKCTDLLLLASSPILQTFDIDHNKDSQTLYQKFTFINSIVGTDDFAEAIHRIVTSPVAKWIETTEIKDIRNVRRFRNSNIKEILKGSNRSDFHVKQCLNYFSIETFPDRISSARKTDSFDTSENRFIKFALETFLKFFTDINRKAKEYGNVKMEKESYLVIYNLENYLHHTIFLDISRPTTLKLNSPVLQRKEGYREVLRVWLLFDLAAKLIWTGGDDIYLGGKKDIATLYEYWIFFKLLDLFQEIFVLEPKDITDLIKETPDGLNLQLKQGKFTALRGISDLGTRKLNIRFNYNRSFSGNNTYPASGSWTATLRPDYTLSFWPYGISEMEAEIQELIVHIHFDAKYKIANFNDFLNQNAEDKLDIEKEEHRKGIYKNADLLKMHAYKDAIRRTGGAYILYPGDKSINQKGFHEIIPGLGAFSLKPSKVDSGIGELKAFIMEIIDHFINRSSQREKIAYRTYNIYKTPPDNNNILKESLPEPYNFNRDLIPDDTFVLVAFYKSKEHYQWIEQNNLYNFRVGSAAGSLIIDIETVSSKYLLLHTLSDANSGDLWRIVSKGPKVYSKEDMIHKGYRSPTQENYLVIEIDRIAHEELKGVRWDFRKLKNFYNGRASAFPFTVSLTELMRNKINLTSE